MSFFGESFRFYTPFILAFWLPSSPVAVAAPPVAAPPVAAPPVAAPPVANPSQKLQLETSDGLALSARYYAVAPQKPLATVLLLHDLEGSHKTVDPLAKLLQKNGILIVKKMTILLTGNIYVMVEMMGKAGLKILSKFT